MTYGERIRASSDDELANILMRLALIVLSRHVGYRRAAREAASLRETLRRKLGEEERK